MKQMYKRYERQDNYTGMTQSLLQNSQFLYTK